MQEQPDFSALIAIFVYWVNTKPGETRDDTNNWGRDLPEPVGKAATTFLVSLTSANAVKISTSIKNV